MGFNVINKLAEDYNIDVIKKNFDSLYGSGIIENEKVILVKPQTYMNLSGNAVSQFVNYYKIDLNDMIIIYDDMDIEISKIRVRKSGSARTGIIGIKSIIASLGTEEFQRIRVGIGKPKYEDDYITYVIGAIPEEEKQDLKEGVIKAENATIEFLKNGINSAMNKFN